MTIQERIEYVWNAALERAIGEGNATPFDAADNAARKYCDKLTTREWRMLAQGE